MPKAKNIQGKKFGKLKVIARADRIRTQTLWLCREKEVGLDKGIISGRLRCGWTIERALTTPIKRKKVIQ